MSTPPLSKPGLGSSLIASRRSISIGFLGLGLFMGMWGVMVPLRSADLGLSELMISGFLLTIGLSLCAAIFLVTRVPALQDAGRLIRCSGPVYAFGFAVCLLTGSMPVFFIAGMVTGFAAGFLDTGLNGQSSQWEQQADRRSMSSFHALFSLGMLIGAGLVTWLLSAGHDPKAGILVCALVYSGIIAANRSWIAADPSAPDDGPPSGRPIRLSLAVILFLGGAITLASLVEGGVIDWSALHLHRVLALPVDEAGRAVLFFSVAMTISRFAGDRLASFVAPNLLLAVPLVIAGILLLAAVTKGAVLLMVCAYVFIGLALGNAFPIIVSEAGRAAGDQPLREISVIVGFAYFGLISGPALFGVLAHFLGLDTTILAIASMALLLGLASFAMPRFVASAGSVSRR
ncbi:MAG: MFS transporter [Pseudomonadota bacterium]|nr:MFS transporter [Pseudomonadota bacterium]MEC8127216.1 MFS transporter [Pseudomonadota bacterium]MEC8672476.1 MFS transporter [Pseudomonadota bacterium]